MQTLLRRRGIGGLLLAQSQVAFNDNATKLVLIGLVHMLLPEDDADRMVSLISLLLVTPFVLFAPLSGWLADRFPRRHVMAASLWLQLAIMALLFAAVAGRSLPVAVGGFFLLGLQSALMSPARRGLVKDLAGDSVGEVMGWMEMLCIAAILAGSLGGGQLIDGLTGALGQPWMAAGVAIGLLAVGCAAALWAFRQVPVHPVTVPRSFSIQTVFGHRELFSSLRQDRGLWRAAWGDAVFYLAGGILLLTLSQVGRELFPDGRGAAGITGSMLAMMGGGVAIGSILAARLSRHHICLGLVPLGALLMSLLALGLSFLTPGSPAFFAGLLLLGLGAGLYLVPLGAYLVDRAPSAERGKILAASSMVSSLTGMLAVGISLAVSPWLGTSGQLILLSAGLFVTALFACKWLSQDVLRLVALSFARGRYAVVAAGTENLPAHGGALIVCNHVSYVDTLVLSLAAPRPIRFLSYAEFFKMPVLGSILRLAGSIPVSSTKARDAIVQAAEHIQRGELVCIFPEGQLTRTGCLMELKSGFELIARRAGCPVVVAHLDGLWGSIFSFAEGRYFTKCPQPNRRRVTVSFAPAPQTAEATAPRVREILLELGEAAFRNRPQGRRLAAQLIHALKKHPARICLEDPTSGHDPLRALPLLAGARILSRLWRRNVPEQRVGLVLPPGLGGTLANLAVLFAGKVPVNLNPTLGPESARSCLEQAGIKTVVTATVVRKKFPNFPWPEHVLFLDRELAALPPLTRGLAFLECLLLPTWLVVRRIGLGPGRPDDEAVLLFTSGTSGQPKGVVLTNRNLLANLQQISETGFLRADDRLGTALPLFHSFGLTMGLFFPLLASRTVVTAPSPLDCEKLAVAARDGLPTVLLTTPTFLRNYVRRISRDAFGTLRLIVTGAEKLPAGTATAARARFGCAVMEGYGLTEASPVVCLNMPHPAGGIGASSIQQGSQDGSVGRLLPGLALRLLDPETQAHLPGATHGLLALRGANITQGYLGEIPTEKFRDGWFLTGDVVRVQPDGFVFLEGRLSRFSKIGGEMISHAAVEQAIAAGLGGEHQDCVLGRPSPDKGEELVLLTTRSLCRDELRKSTTLPNLWLPRQIVTVTRLPLLASGKLDLAECAKLVNPVVTIS